MVLWSLQNLIGGEIFVPKIPSYRITDLAEAIGPSCKKEIIGIRPGEKIHEEMITIADSFSTYDMGDYFAILSPDVIKETEHINIKGTFQKVPIDFAYNSGTNPDFLSVSQIRSLIKKHIDKDFIPV